MFSWFRLILSDSSIVNHCHHAKSCHFSQEGGIYFCLYSGSFSRVIKLETSFHHLTLWNYYSGSRNFAFTYSSSPRVAQMLQDLVEVSSNRNRLNGFRTFCSKKGACESLDDVLSLFQAFSNFCLKLTSCNMRRLFFVLISKFETPC